MKKNSKAIILLSGGIDSLTCLAMAKAEGYDCYALSFDYGQRHRAELKAAAVLAKDYHVFEHRVVDIGLKQFGGSALLDPNMDLPDFREQQKDQSVGEPAVNVNYVPARNTIFLAIALGWAEVVHANTIFLGVNALDYADFPDARPEYIKAFQTMANLATQAAVVGDRIQIKTPLLQMTKAEIIQAGAKLHVDYSLTVTCYRADDKGRACGHCDSCKLRQQGFIDANIPDPV